MGEILKTYRNSTPVIEINGYKMKVEDIVFASLMGGLNLLLVSERGEGKTQILYDVLYGIFGGKGTYIRTSPDMEIKDVYTSLNLEKLKEMEGTTEDVIKLVEQAKNPFTAIDELNRAPPIVQNQLLNVLDGYIEVKGKRYPLGVDIGGETYHVGIATINFGNHEYVGTFNIDSAILDRFGFTLDLDHFSPTTDDLIEILFQNPSLTQPKVEDKSSKIFEHYKKIKERKLPLEPLITILYLRYGVNYFSAEPYCQRKTRGILPEGVHEGGDIQSLLRPISVRTSKQIAQLYKSLTYLAELKGYETREEYYFPNTLETIKLVLPYSGCLKMDRVNSRYYGSPILATEDVIKRVKEKFTSVRLQIVESIKKKKDGKLTKEDLDKFNGEWGFMKEIVEKIEV